MYTPLKSAKVTLAISYLFCAILFILMIFAPPIVKYFFAKKNERIVMYAFYLCTPAAWTALVCIIRLMKKIIAGEIFTEKNVFSMRLLSWCCAFVSLVCLVAGCNYAPLLTFCLGSAFMTLILRVLKNVMSLATEMKNENELTI